MENNIEEKTFNKEEQTPASETVANLGIPVPSAMPTTSNPGSEIKYAGFWVRFVAGTIDGFVLLIPSILLALFLNITLKNNSELIVNIASVILTMIYYVWMTNKDRATVGKKVMGIEVRSDSTEDLTLNRIILRETIGKLISYIILLIGYIMAGFTAKKQALHDMMAKTVVVYKNPDQKFSGWAIFWIVISCILPVIATIGILASIVLLSLVGAKGKAQDGYVKSIMSSIQTEMILYQEENGSYANYRPKADTSTSCAGNPVTNISTDKQHAAVFMKSCDKKNKNQYYCVDSSGAEFSEEILITEETVLSGATNCR
jgi:uncharacterized RDD family membrane protein YckC